MCYPTPIKTRPTFSLTTILLFLSTRVPQIMMISSETFTYPVMDALGVDPKELELPKISSMDAFVAAIHEALPIPPPFADDFARTPGLVPDDGTSQSSNSPPSSPETYDYFSPPQYNYIDPASVQSPSTSTSFGSPSPGPLPSRVLNQAPCAGGKPVKQKDGYRCPSCNDLFKRRDDCKRHIDSAGMRVACKYCGKAASGRRDGKLRHLRTNKRCLEIYRAGFEAGRFTGKRVVEDAYY